MVLIGNAGRSSSAWGMADEGSCMRRAFRLPRSRRQRRILKWIAAIVGTYVVLSILFGTIVGSGEEAIKGEVRELEWNTRESDSEWVPALRNGRIVDCQVFKPGGSAISEKHLAVLEHKGSYYKAVVKLAEHPKYSAYTPPIYRKEQVESIYSTGSPHAAQLERIPHLLYRRAARSFQAVPEILSFHVDRILGFYRKPPFVGRVVSTRDLYGHIHVFQTWNPLTWLSLFSFKSRSFFSQSNVYVSFTPWMAGVRESPPSLAVKNILVHDDSIARVTPESDAMETLRTVSDTLVFDYLVDEHDRKAEKNWVVSKNGTYLHWDNGLAFDHGPIMTPSCARILCGHNGWRDADQDLLKVSSCKKVCRFTRRTYDLLNVLTEPGYELGALLEKSIQSDILAPGFQLLLYERYWRDDAPVRFRSREMFDSLSLRVFSLLEHIDDCVSRYGSNEVFI